MNLRRLVEACNGLSSINTWKSQDAVAWNALEYLRDNGEELLAVLGEARKDWAHFKACAALSADNREHARLTALLARLDAIAGAAE